MRGNSKQGFVLSILLHVSVAATALVLSTIKPADKENMKFFELVAGPPSSNDDAAGGGAEAVEFTMPASRPALSRAPTPPQRAPAPPPQRVPDPVRKPAPAPQKPAPTPPKPAPAQPQTSAPISYEDWVKQHGPPRTSPVRTPSPRPSTNVPRIDTVFNPGVATGAGGGGARQGATSGTPGATTDPYISRIVDALRQVWDKPVGLADVTQAVVEFDVTADGRLINVSIVKPSGNAQFDRSVMECFRDVGSVGNSPDQKPRFISLTMRMTD